MCAKIHGDEAFFMNVMVMFWAGDFWASGGLRFQSIGPRAGQAFLGFVRYNTQLCIYSKSVKFISLAFLYIDFHFYPSLQTSYDATCHIESYFEDPPKIDNFFPSQHFQFFTKKWGNENVAMGKNCEFLADVQNRTQYDRWHQKKSVEMDQSESQYIKKPEK